MQRGEVLGILGESGSGKSVTLRALMRLLPLRKTRLGGPHRDRRPGRDGAGPAALARLRGPTVAMIFQEPMTALDPVFTIGQQIVEAIAQHEPLPRAGARASARWSCSSSCRSLPRSAGSMRIRTSSRAGCASAR